MAIVQESELPEKTKNLWLKSLAAFELQNDSYAISLLQALLKDEPGFLDGRRLLRKAAVRKKKGAKKLINISTGGLSAMKLQSLVKKDPAAAIAAIEDKILAGDPHNQQGNLLLHESAMALGEPEIATFALETAVLGNPNNTRVMHQLAEHYMQSDMADKASEIYTAIVRKDPTDLDAIKGSKDATARASMKRQGWDDAGSYRDVMKSGDDAKALEDSARAVMTLEQIDEQLEKASQAYNENPENVNTVRMIASLLEKRAETADNFDDQIKAMNDAAEFYDYASGLRKGGDAALHKKADRLREMVQDLEIKNLHERIRTSPDDPEIEGLQAHLDELEKSRAEKLLERARQRVERNPTDAQLRFGLAQILMETEQFDLAIPELQRAVNNPHLRINVMHRLGRCYDKKGMHDMAAEQLEKAVAELFNMDTTKKDVLYDLGLVYEELGQSGKSLECFKQIYQSDYGYRDVAARVEKSYSKA